MDSLWNSSLVSDDCRAHLSMKGVAPDIAAVDQSAALRYLLQCERTAKLKALAFKLCAGVVDSGARGGHWELEQVYRVYRDSKRIPSEVNPVQMLGTHTNLDRCCHLFPQDGQRLVDCLRAARPLDFTTLFVTDPDLTRQVFSYLTKLGPPLRTALEMGSGKGNWMASLGRAGVETVVGIEPGYMGSLALYEESWDAKYSAVQLDILLADGGEGDLQFNAFLCERFGHTNFRFDLVWSVEVFEHIPKSEHCRLLNRLAGLSNRWVLTSIAPPNQQGIGHIASMKKSDWRREWEARGFEEIVDPGFSALRKARWLQFRKNAMLFRREDWVKSVACVA